MVLSGDGAASVTPFSSVYPEGGHPDRHTWCGGSAFCAVWTTFQYFRSGLHVPLSDYFEESRI